jgi:anti-anti-sigma factor
MSNECSSPFRFAQVGDTLVVELGDRLALENRQELRSEVVAALAGGVRLVRVRFAPAERPTFVDSSGWGVLVALTRKAPESGARLVLADVDPGNREHLGMTRLEEFFCIEPPGEERLAA